ncbi:MAG: hypothetical protein K0R76_647 [Alphaproteobacteria bacterium]|jgi:hypothetical protein|nr:hypothetical protein [Alphaproteobacteria bacterium]
MMINYLKYIATYVLLLPFSQNGTADSVDLPNPPEYIETSKDRPQVNEESSPAPAEEAATPRLPPAPAPFQQPMVDDPSSIDTPTRQGQTAEQHAIQTEFQAKALERAIKRQAAQIKDAQQQADQEDARQKAFYENSARQSQTEAQDATPTSHPEQPLATQEQDPIARIEAKLEDIQLKVQTMESQTNMGIAGIQAQLAEIQAKIQAPENPQDKGKRVSDLQEGQPVSHSSPDEHGNSIHDNGQKPESDLDKG